MSSITTGPGGVPLPEREPGAGTGAVAGGVPLWYGVPRREDYLNISHKVTSWLLTRDHKRIGIMYMISITLFFFIGGAAAVVMRLELMTPRGDLVQAENYNKLFTLHGVMMIFFFLIPAIPATL